MGLKDLKIIHISSQSNHFLRIKDANSNLKYILKPLRLFLFDRLMGVFKSREFAATEIFICLCFYILSVVLSLVWSRRTTAGKKNKTRNVISCVSIRKSIKTSDESGVFVCICCSSWLKIWSNTHLRRPEEADEISIQEEIHNFFFFFIALWKLFRLHHLPVYKKEKECHVSCVLYCWFFRAVTQNSWKI